jgi:iron complex transport system substrate-binding protein
MTPGELPQPTTTLNPQPINLTDGLGRAVTLHRPAQQVVSLAPSNTEVLFAVGAGPQVVARDEFTNYPPQAIDLPAIGGSFGDYNLEAIVALEPDLVLAAEINPPELVTSLEDLGLTVYYLANPVDLAGMYENLRIVGRLTGHQAHADALVDALAARVEAMQIQVALSSYRPSVFYEIDSSDPSAPWTSGPGTFIDTLIGMAGGTNIAGDLDDAYAQLSIEALVARDPDIILLGDAIYGVTPEDVAQRPGWEDLSAVQNGRIYPFNDDLASRPGPRLVDGLEALAVLLHTNIP